MRLDLSPEGDGHAFGWHDKSMGTPVRDGEARRWLRVQWRVRNTVSDKLWYGNWDARDIEGVRKPRVLRSEEWITDGVEWRADLMDYVHSRPCSPTPPLLHAISLSGAWWSSLRHSLDSLARHPTERVAIRQDLVTRRIGEYFGAGMPAEVRAWTTVHSDLHWANVTAPECWIVDWEAWGRGPAGFDAALLLCYSLAQPDVAWTIRTRFADWLDTPDGSVAQAFACAELLRMAELHGDHPEIYPHLQDFANQLRQGLRS